MNYIDIINNNKKALRGKEFTIANTKVKIVGIGYKSIKVLYMTKSKFQQLPHWDQTWFKYSEKTVELEELIIKMVESID